MAKIGNQSGPLATQPWLKFLLGHSNCFSQDFGDFRVSQVSSLWLSFLYLVFPALI